MSSKSTRGHVRLSRAQARARVLEAQRLVVPSTEQPSKAAELTSLVEQVGLLRTLGGVDVYLALRARGPALRRADLDAAVERGDLRVLPAVRGCIYLVPRRYQAAALRLAESLTQSRAAREHEKAGIRSGELETVAEAVLDALAAGPMTPAQLRKALPDGIVRGLGDAGKKVGISSTLPPALRQLEFAGQVERALVDHRLDSEAYAWRLPSTDLFREAPVPDTEVDLHAVWADLFFRAAGFGTKKGLAAWVGISQRAAAAAMERLDLVEVEIEGLDELAFLPAECADHLDALLASSPGVAFLPFEDNLIALHEGPAFFVDPAYRDIPVPVWGRGKGTTLGDVRHSTFRTVVVQGRIAGFWEFDPDSEQVVHHCFDTVAAAGQESVLVEAAENLGRFVRDELGHGRSFSIDKDDNLRRRAEQIRELAGS